jgi:diadenosine tetraphosphate (Ap4A) HIT family hydrolase
MFKKILDKINLLHKIVGKDKLIIGTIYYNHLYDKDDNSHNHKYRVKYNAKYYILNHNCNDRYDAGHKSILPRNHYNNISDEHKSILSECWGKYKEGDKVKGIIKNNMFEIINDKI